MPRHKVTDDERIAWQRLSLLSHLLQSPPFFCFDSVDASKIEGAAADAAEALLRIPRVCSFAGWVKSACNEAIRVAKEGRPQLEIGQAWGAAAMLAIVARSLLPDVRDHSTKWRMFGIGYQVDECRRNGFSWEKIANQINRDFNEQFTRDDIRSIHKNSFVKKMRQANAGIDTETGQV